MMSLMRDGGTPSKLFVSVKLLISIGNKILVNLLLKLE